MTDLRVFRPKRRMIALGLAVNHLMSKPAFRQLAFGEWSKTLAGMINRDHYFFVIDHQKQVQGFAGWALTSRDKADGWLAGRLALQNQDCVAGDCIIMNVWSASGKHVHRFMMRETRKLLGDKAALYYRRYYENGERRSICLNGAKSRRG